MLAPIDKLRSGVNDTIQIIVTTACTLSCSNCTQLLPFRQDARHMSLECFREAVESLRDWPGIVGIFGGNPCNHPKFPNLCRILSEIIPQERRGLWSNDLLGYGEIAAETFYPKGRFNLNAHGVEQAAVKINAFLPQRLIPGSDTKQASHAAMLVNYKDFEINDDQWMIARENCDINQRWSGAIAEREGKPFAYFCEVAAALDGIRGTNHGIPAVPGWWRETMANTGFLSQTRNCCDKGCGVPLKMQGHKDNEEVYDVSPSWDWLHLKKQQQVSVEVHKEIPGHVKTNTDYMGVQS